MALPQGWGGEGYLPQMPHAGSAIDHTKCLLYHWYESHFRTKPQSMIWRKYEPHMSIFCIYL